MPSGYFDEVFFFFDFASRFFFAFFQAADASLLLFGALLGFGPSFIFPLRIRDFTEASFILVLHFRLRPPEVALEPYILLI